MGFAIALPILLLKGDRLKSSEVDRKKRKKEKEEAIDKKLFFLLMVNISSQHIIN
jgi:hypothetical protein